MEIITFLSRVGDVGVLDKFAYMYVGILMGISSMTIQDIVAYIKKNN